VSYRKLGLLFAVAALPFGAAGRARAQGVSSSAECTTEDLLARRLPIGRQDVRGDIRLPTDGTAAPEGAQWDAPVGVTLDTPAGSLTYDLGSVREVRSFMVQADANDTYKIFGAEDNQPGAYKLLVEVDSVVATQGHGLRTRTATIDPTPVRYLRIGEPLGDGFYSVSEFQAYCRPPVPFPPKLPIADAPQAKVVQLPWWKFGWWENDASSRLEMALALAGVALIGWGLWLAKKGTPSLHRKLRDALLASLGVLSFCAYWNFFCFHFGNYIHMWDTFHYYIGSKYFKEISYDRLYECVAVADSEQPDLRRRVELRKIMNLRTNMMVSTTDVLAHPEACKSHFTPERWQSFKHDVAYFRNHHDIKRWEEAQTDHGYNGSPVWNIAGTTLTNSGPATDAQIKWLTRIDPVFILLLCGMTWWAFGWRTLCVALAVFATNFPCRFYWTGGSLLRWDWLFYLVGGICLIKKDRPLVGGFFLGYSTLLRIFPLFIFSGPILVLLRQLWGGPAPDRPWWKPEPWPNLRALAARADRRFVAILGGAAIALAVLFPVSLLTSSGIAGYRAFAFNTKKHKETPLTNYMGLRTVVAYSPGEAGRVLKDDRLEDPWGTWKKTKVDTYHRRFVLFAAFGAAYLVLLFGAVRGAEPWEACALGATMMAVGVELTCYYYSFLFAVALLYSKRREAGAILLAVTAATGFIDWSPTRYLPDSKPWGNLKMSQWLDEQYMWMAVATLIGFVWLLYRFGNVPSLGGGAEAELAMAAGDGSREAAGDGASPARDGRKRSSRMRGRGPRIRRGR
jgi:hypothetical protein